MGGFFALVLLAGCVYTGWRLMTNAARRYDSQQQQGRIEAFRSRGEMEAYFQERLQAQRQAQAARRTQAYARARKVGQPLILPETWRAFLPLGLILLIPLLLTALIAKSPVALALMALGVGGLAAVVVTLLNREAREKRQKLNEAEAEVEAATQHLEDFTIPDEWTKKYL